MDPLKFVEINGQFYSAADIVKVFREPAKADKPDGPWVVGVALRFCPAMPDLRTYGNQDQAGGEMMRVRAQLIEVKKAEQNR